MGAICRGGESVLPQGATVPVPAHCDVALVPDVCGPSDLWRPRRGRAGKPRAKPWVTTSKTDPPCKGGALGFAHEGLGSAGVPPRRGLGTSDIHEPWPSTRCPAGIGYQLQSAQRISYNAAAFEDSTHRTWPHARSVSDDSGAGAHFLPQPGAASARAGVCAHCHEEIRGRSVGPLQPQTPRAANDQSRFVGSGAPPPPLGRQGPIVCRIQPPDSRTEASLAGLPQGCHHRACGCPTHVQA
jgi:cytochrome c553